MGVGLFEGRTKWDTMGISSAVRPAASTALHDAEPHDLIVERVRRVVEFAHEFEANVDLETLVELLPEQGPTAARDLETWVRARPHMAHVSGSRVLPPGALDIGIDADRHARAEAYFQEAQQFFASRLSAVHRWVRFFAVTGSTAYGNPRAGDDCDLMAIVRPGTVWVFLAYVFLRARLASGSVSPPHWCFNYTLDERAAIGEFARPRGFLFAREALIARPVEGEGYYRGLLESGPWLRVEAPRLFARWERVPRNLPSEPRPAPVGVRILNAVLFPAFAAYLHLKGLRVNHQLGRNRRPSERFRTITRLDRMTLQTTKFDRLSSRMHPASRLPPQ